MRSFLLSKKYTIMYLLLTIIDIFDLVYRSPQDDPDTERFRMWTIAERILVVIRFVDLVVWLLAVGIVRD